MKTYNLTATSAQASRGNATAKLSPVEADDALNDDRKHYLVDWRITGIRFGDGSWVEGEAHLTYDGSMVGLSISGLLHGFVWDDIKLLQDKASVIIRGVSRDANQRYDYKVPGKAGAS